MRLLLAIPLALFASACTDKLAELPDPPVLRVTSPERSLIRDHAGALAVTGTVAANADGVPVSSVTVNNAPATVNADGSFSAMLDLTPGATLIHTEATDQNGGKAKDTRSVEAGELRTASSPIDDALTTAISKAAFAKIAVAAGTVLKTTDFKSVLPSLNPIMHSGDPGGEDCLFARLYVDDFKMTNAVITLVPVAGGLSFSAKLDGVDAPGHMRYAVLCAAGQNATRVTATSATISGTLTMTADNVNGFKTDLTNPVVKLSGLNITASGIPGEILGMISLDSLIENLAPRAAKQIVGPMVTRALGGLAGPREIVVMGQTVVVQAKASNIVFDANDGLVTLDSSVLIKGTETKRFVYTVNGVPSMDPGNGLVIGIADDLANAMLAQLTATGVLTVKTPSQSGAFDVELVMTSPPMISADPADGKMRMVLPDMMATFTMNGKPMAKVAVNGTVELKITPASTGNAIAIELEAPTLEATTLDDIPNRTGYTDADFAKTVELGVGNQILAVKALMATIPLPALPGGMKMKDMSVGADDGYMVANGTLE